MKRKGDLIFWEISEMNVTKELLESLGFERFAPRNDFKSAMIKVLMQVTKGNDRLYRRFNDKSDEVSFGVFYEHISADNIAINKELIIKVDKEHGNLTFSDAGHPLAAQVRDLYRVAKETLDAKQIRSLVQQIVKRECHGIPMRSSGGVYFIDARFDELRERLTQLFNSFPTQMKLHTVPCYDDAGTTEAIEYAANENIFGEINALVADIDRRFKEGTITRRQMEGDKIHVAKILEKITVHRDNLRTKALDLSKLLDNVSTSITKLFGNVEAGIIEPGDFMAMLGSL